MSPARNPEWITETAESGSLPDRRRSLRGIVAVGDFNGDAKLDLVSRTPTSISILLGNGDGTFPSHVTFPLPSAPPFVHQVAVGDFDSNSKLDLVVVYDQTMEILVGRGDGSFLTMASYLVGSPSAIVVEDLNGDSKPDLAIAHYGGSVTVFLGNGDGTFLAGVDYSAGPKFGYASIGVGDFNGDSKPDLVVTKDDVGVPWFIPSAGIDFLFGKGDGSFFNTVNYPIGWYPSSIAVGDFDGDSKPDLALTNTASHTVRVMLGVCNGL